MLSPTAVQRAFHWEGEKAVAKAAEKFGLWFGISSLATHSIEDIAKLTSGPKLFQLYVHKDHGLNEARTNAVKEKFDALVLTVDTVVSKRERCLNGLYTSIFKIIVKLRNVSKMDPQLFGKRQISIT